MIQVPEPYKKPVLKQKPYDERVDDMLHELEQSHLRSIRRKGAVHIDIGVHFCPVCKDALKNYIMDIIEEVY